MPQPQSQTSRHEAPEIVVFTGDIAVEAGHTSDELWGDESVVPVRPSTYLFFAAIAVFVLGGLAGRRGAVAARSLGPTRLAQPVVRFSSTVVIIGLVLAANAGRLEVESAAFD